MYKKILLYLLYSLNMINEAPDKNGFLLTRCVPSQTYNPLLFISTWAKLSSPFLFTSAFEGNLE